MYKGMIISGTPFNVICGEGFEFRSGETNVSIKCEKGTLTPPPPDCLPGKHYSNIITSKAIFTINKDYPPTRNTDSVDSRLSRLINIIIGSKG